MTESFFFYDLETSGLDPRWDRIMQFAGQRTDSDLNPIGDPYNILVKLNDDTLPSPDALMVTGITPQETQADGYTEAEFAKLLMSEIFTPGTTAVGYNNVRFDDEFIRHLFWRNFYDPYEWTWRDGRSRWDLLDVVRMTRALRPEGIEWPLVDGIAINKLENIAAANGLNHTKAHDALSDVEALIDITRLIHNKQPALFEHLLKFRDKNQVKQLINLDNKQPFVYVNGQYDSAYHSATVAFPLTSGRNNSVVVYDLRYDPTPLLNLSIEQLEKIRFAKRDERQAEGFINLPVKQLQYNRVPAVAPLGVLERGDGWRRLGLTPELIDRHRKVLLSSPAFAENVRSVFEKEPDFEPATEPEAQLYDGFLPQGDALSISKVRQADVSQLADLHPNFIDERLDDLLLHYKARNYPQSLAEDEVVSWEKWRSDRIKRQLPDFISRLQSLAQSETADDKQFILQELQLWAESIVPVED
ncbi:exodeoxyribonuclease I [Candidatus Saccharibacteria bacterium 32-49-12]|nr:MAG: exodeoxyribonuclease I [Candidatus Saccharibacteria bacterium 32-49-12]